MRRPFTLFARSLRALPASAIVLAAAIAPAPAQAPAASPGAPPPPAPASSAQLIQRIQVTGTQRIEPATVLTYITLREGDLYDPQAADAALKALYATGLFADVK